ncbi:MULTISPECIES: hypothetical protein [Streptomyces]|uniref:Uncharacterized protein n=2 Tax=Streptomyces TaxID=1883 RepID=A0ABU2RME9_9ACTN|nr:MULTISPECIES: hypothetical protein [unclassified Streptomyces]MBK3594807.1 hypothetical protein [Streptomyces sp. MBT51]MDT0430043.1 hypothetical protein [Streptomyces sp. DSM 41770]
MPPTRGASIDRAEPPAGQRHPGTDEAATAYVEQLAADKRYARDVY